MTRIRIRKSKPRAISFFNERIIGAGTSLEGQVQAVRGGISIDTRQMNQIRRISGEDMDATVEAGVSRTQLVNALENTGLTFFIDPGGDATLGAMARAPSRASGGR